MVIRNDEADEALEVVNGTRRTNLPRWAQNVLGFVVGSSLVALAGLGINDHERLTRLSHVVEGHDKYLDTVKAFHKEPRFTEKDAIARHLPLQKDIESIKEDHKELKQSLEKLEDDYTNLLREFFELQLNIKAAQNETEIER